MQTVVRRLVAAIDQGIQAFDGFNAFSIIRELGQIGIVFPQSGTASPNIGEKPARVAAVQIADRGRQHDDVAGRKRTVKN